VAGFRLLPPDTTADPAFLEHLGRAAIAERNGAFMYRFDPACNGQRRPVSAWPLLGRIEAPTLLVRGEHSPILPRPMAEEMLAALRHARLVEIAGAHHHLVLDAPEVFSSALEEFLAEVD
jgi:pimeloyl-ACP methyl ester carboxylesterase